MMSRALVMMSWLLRVSPGRSSHAPAKHCQHGLHSPGADYQGEAGRAAARLPSATSSPRRRPPQRDTGMRVLGPCLTHAPHTHTRMHTRTLTHTRTHSCTHARVHARTHARTQAHWDLPCSQGRQTQRVSDPQILRA